jgi:hypothetical protein
MNNTEYSKILTILKKDEVIFKGFIQLVPPHTISQIKSAQRCSQNFSSRAEVNKIIESCVENQINYVLAKKKPKYGNLGNELPKLLKSCDSILSDSIKDSVVKKICSPMNDFYTYSRKSILEIAYKWARTEGQSLSIIKNHHRCLTEEMIGSLLKNVTGGLNHPDLKKIKDTSSIFSIIELNKLIVDEKKHREKIIQIIAKTPSIMSKLDAKLTITLADLKKIPPVRRFNFLQYLYRPIFGSTSYRGTYRYRLATIHLAKNKTILPIEKISKEDMKELLFSVAIRKNDEITTWWNRYEEYSKVLKKYGRSDDN